MKYVFVIFGTLALLLGLLGVFLPILPTTPFVLLAAFMYLHGSKRLHQWLITHPVFGIYISDYFQKGGIRRTAKKQAYLFLWASLLVSIVWIDSWLIRGLLLIIGAGVTWHLAAIKTLDD